MCNLPPCFVFLPSSNILKKNRQAKQKWSLHVYSALVWHVS